MTPTRCQLLAELTAARGDLARWQKIVSLAFAVLLGELEALRAERG